MSEAAIKIANRGGTHEVVEEIARGGPAREASACERLAAGEEDVDYSSGRRDMTEVDAEPGDVRKERRDPARALT